MEIKKLKDYVGKCFGIFKVIKDNGLRFASNKSLHKNRFLLIECIKCFHIFETTLNNVTRLSQNNCHQKHKSRISMKVSNAWTRIRNIRQKMINRCYRENDTHFKYYGAKSILICDLWLSSAINFYEWSIKNGYGNGLTIDRIDNEKGYFPENCRWISLKDQNRNRSHVLGIEKVKTIKKLLKDGYTHQIIANIVLTKKSRVSDISAGKCWVDIN